MGSGAQQSWCPDPPLLRDPGPARAGDMATAAGVRKGGARGTAVTVQTRRLARGPLRMVEPSSREEGDRRPERGTLSSQVGQTEPRIIARQAWSKDKTVS